MRGEGIHGDTPCWRPSISYRRITLDSRPRILSVGTPEKVPGYPLVEYPGTVGLEGEWPLGFHSTLVNRFHHLLDEVILVPVAGEVFEEVL